MGRPENAFHFWGRGASKRCRETFGCEAHKMSKSAACDERCFLNLFKNEHRTQSDKHHKSHDKIANAVRFSLGREKEKTSVKAKLFDTCGKNELIAQFR